MSQSWGDDAQSGRGELSSKKRIKEMQRWGTVDVAMPTRCLERHNIRPDGNTAAVRLDYIVSRVHAYAGVPRGGYTRGGYTQTSTCL